MIFSYALRLKFVRFSEIMQKQLLLLDSTTLCTTSIYTVSSLVAQGGSGSSLAKTARSTTGTRTIPSKPEIPWEIECPTNVISISCIYMDAIILILSHTMLWYYIKLYFVISYYIILYYIVLYYLTYIYVTNYFHICIYMCVYLFYII